jgi:hypothetical protein
MIHKFGGCGEYISRYLGKNLSFCVVVFLAIHSVENRVFYWS